MEPIGNMGKGPSPVPNPGDEELVYWVDQRNHVVRANEPWHRFAQLNGVAFSNLTADQGIPLKEAIRGRETRYLFGLILDRVREGRGPIVLPFRCDSPSHRRYMEQTILLSADGLVEIRCRLLKEEARPQSTSVPLNPAKLTAVEMIYCCDWCKKLEAAPGRWVEAEELAREMGRSPEMEIPRLSHGSCPACTGHITSLLNQ